MEDIGNYDGGVAAALRSASATVGDRVRMRRGDTVREGILMPGDPGGQSNHVVLKLDSGYNMGIEVTDDTDIERLPDDD